MFDMFLSGPIVPFTLALAILGGLLLLELTLALVGGSVLSMGPEADLPDVGDIDLPDLAAFGVDADLADFELDAPGADAASGGLGGFSTAAALLGLGRVPLLLWLAAFLLGFGAIGLMLQTAVHAVFGHVLPALLAGLPAALGGLAFARSFGGVFARLLPKTETQSVSERHLGRRMGVVTQGVAARGRPAEVRVRDRYGNVHYLRAEPLRDDEVIAEGSEVLVLRHRPDGGYRLVNLDP